MGSWLYVCLQGGGRHMEKLFIFISLVGDEPKPKTKKGITCKTQLKDWRRMADLGYLHIYVSNMMGETSTREQDRAKVRKRTSGSTVDAFDFKKGHSSSVCS